MTINTTQRTTSMVFIDGSLADLQAILSGIDPSVTAVVLDPAQDGVQQMADALKGVSGLDAIHIISHGSIGQFNLGAAQLTQDTLAQYQTQLATIGNALSVTGDLLLYGCNVAQGVQGQAFISALSNATGAVVPERVRPAALLADRFFERRTKVMTRADESPETPRTHSSGRKPANRYASIKRLRLRIVAIAKSCPFLQGLQTLKTGFQQGFQANT